MFRCVGVLSFHIFCHYWAKEKRSLCRGLRYIVIRNIEVPLYNFLKIITRKLFQTASCSQPQYAGGFRGLLHSFPPHEGTCAWEATTAGNTHYVLHVVRAQSSEHLKRLMLII